MNSVDKLSSKLLDAEDVEYYFTTRHFGFSSHPYKSLNFGFHVGDKRENVEKNHKLLAKHLNYNFKDLVYMNQIHSNQVVEITDKNMTSPLECDGVVSKLKNLPLMVMSADCTPVLLYSKESKKVAALHIGRAGAFKNIVKNGVKKLDSSAENIIAILGPSIHQCCYEVGEEIYLEAKKLSYGFSIKKFKESYYLDVNSIIVHQLISEGINEENIEILNHCTSCQVENFFSYRKEGITGRMAAVICLKS